MSEPIQRPISKTRRQWCFMLAKLTAPMAPEQATTAFVAMLPMLTADDKAYNRTTLEAAAKREVGDPAVPNFDKISRVLGAWWRDNLPIRVRMGGSPSVAPPALPEPPPKTLEEIAADHAHVDKVLAAFRADMAKRRGEPSDVPAASPRGTLPEWNPGAVPAAVALDRNNNPLIRAARAQQAREQGACDAECDRQHSLAAE